jgi:serine/threonine protein kinase
LKLDNVMLAADGHVKIADFGMCKEDMPYGATTGTFCGTPDYLAPEICDAWLGGEVSDQLKYTTAVDYWTLGVVVYEMATNCSPFAGEDDDELFLSIRKDPIVIGPEISKGMRSCILGFLERDPTKRLGCSKTGQRDCKDHVFFNAIDWTKLAKKGMPPPMIPKAGTSNFDELYLSQTPELTPTNQAEVLEIDQHLFADFSFVVASAATAEEYVPPKEFAPSRAVPTAEQRAALLKSATMGGKGNQIKLNPRGDPAGKHLPSAEEKAALMAKAMGGTPRAGGGRAGPTAEQKAALMAKAQGGRAGPTAADKAALMAKAMGK